MNRKVATLTRGRSDAAQAGPDTYPPTPPSPPSPTIPSESATAAASAAAAGAPWREMSILRPISPAARRLTPDVHRRGEADPTGDGARPAGGKRQSIRVRTGPQTLPGVFPVEPRQSRAGRAGCARFTARAAAGARSRPRRLLRAALGPWVTALLSRITTPPPGGGVVTDGSAVLSAGDRHLAAATSSQISDPAGALAA